MIIGDAMGIPFSRFEITVFEAIVFEVKPSYLKNLNNNTKSSLCIFIHNFKTH